MLLADCSELVFIRLLGLTDNFYDEIKTLPLEDENDGQIPSFSSARGGMGGRHKKRKVYHVGLRIKIKFNL